MQDLFIVNAEVRSDVGKGASRRLRHAGKIPAVLYGGGEAPVSLTVDHDEMFHHLEHEAFYSHILALKVDGKDVQAVLKDLQRHPAKPVILHVDFLRVSAKEKIKMSVPLHFVGSEEAPGVKLGGLLSHSMTEVEISCLPKDLPEYIEADVSGLALEQILHLSDLKLPKGVELVALAHGAEYDLPVAAVHKTRATKEAGEGAAEGGEGEGEGV